MNLKPLPIVTAGLLAAAPLLLFSQARTWTNSDGQKMEAEIVTVEDDHVVFKRDGRTYNYPIGNLSDNDQTDVRAWADDNEEKLREREGQKKVAQALDGALVRLQGSRLRDYRDPEFQEKRLFAFYYSASWCGPCRRFTPDLVDFYNRIQRQHPEFEIVFVSSDRDVRAMEGYMREDRMKWPAIRFDERRDIDIVNKGQGSGIPNLVFMDGSGEIISRSYVNGKYVGPRRVLNDIQNYLSENS